MDINTGIYIYIGFFSWIILWCGFKIIDDRTWSKLDTDVVPAWVLSSGYIITFLRIVDFGVLWIEAIPVTSFVVLLVFKIFKRYFIPKWEHVLLCAFYLTKPFGLKSKGKSPKGYTFGYQKSHCPA